MFTPLEKLDVDQQEGVLEYVFKFGEELCPNILLDEKGESYREPSIAPLRFIARYNKRGRYVEEKNKQMGKMETVWKDYLQDEFDVSIYKNDIEIQKLLEKLGLDEEKFWYLIRFLHNYAYGYCTVGNPLGKSLKEQMEHFCRMFKQHPYLYIELRDGEENKGNKLGKIDNLYFLNAIHDYCAYCLKKKKYPPYSDIKEPKPESDGFFIYYMMKLLKEFFVFMGIVNIRKSKDGEKKAILKSGANQLIIHVLSLAGLFKDNKYDEDENLKQLIKRCSEQDDGNRVNGIYIGDL